MYRIVVKSRGEHNNVALGARYCLTKRTLIDLICFFEKFGCAYDVEKFTRLYGDVFAWSDGGFDERFWEKVDKALEREENNND